MVLGYFFMQTTSYVEEHFTYTATRKYALSRRNGKRQPANVENGGKLMVTWSLLMLAFYVNVMLNLYNALTPEILFLLAFSRFSEKDFTWASENFMDLSLAIWLFEEKNMQRREMTSSCVHYEHRCPIVSPTSSYIQTAVSERSLSNNELVISIPKGRKSSNFVTILMKRG